MSAPPRYARISDQPALERALVDGDVFEVETVAGQSAHVSVAQVREAAVLPSSEDGRALLAASLDEQKARLGVPPPLPSMPNIGDILMAAESGALQPVSLYPALLNHLAAAMAALAERTTHG